ncbi:MAG: SHOCT domain-containing protein [Thaumarchaeota archaeon]|nr:SHOCT domain-containing protein [Nitrososphaerota archaeon]
MFWIWIVAGVLLVFLAALLVLVPRYARPTAPLAQDTGYWSFLVPVIIIFVFFGLTRTLLRPRGAWGWGYRWRWREYDRTARILRERYARGEITKEQFDQMMNELEDRSRVPGNI